MPPMMRRAGRIDLRRARLARGFPLEADPKPVAGGLGNAFQCPRRGFDAAAFETSNHRLLGAHPRGEFPLCQTCARPNFNQRRSQAEFLVEVVIGLAVLWVPEPLLMQLVGRNQLLAHAISSARLRASSISRRGVFCVFFTKTRTTTTRCDWRVTYRARAMPSLPF